MSEKLPISSLSVNELNHLIDIHELDEACLMVFDAWMDFYRENQNNYVGFCELPMVFEYKGSGTFPANAKILHNHKSLTDAVRITTITQLMELLKAHRSAFCDDEIIFRIAMCYLDQGTKDVFKDPYHHVSVVRVMDTNAFNGIDLMGRSIIRDLEGNSPDFLVEKDIVRFLEKYGDNIDDPSWRAANLRASTRERIDRVMNIVAEDLAVAYQRYANYLISHIIPTDKVKNKTIDLIKRGYFNDKFSISKTICRSTESPTIGAMRRRALRQFTPKEIKNTIGLDI